MQKSDNTDPIAMERGMFWVSVGVFGFFALCSLYTALNRKIADRLIGAAAFIVFGLLMLIFGLWPLLRKQESVKRPAVQIGMITVGNRNYPSIRFVYSSVKAISLLMLFGLMLLVGIGMTIRVIQEGPAHWHWDLYSVNPVSAAFVMIVGIVLNISIGKQLLRNRLGVSVTEAGIVWEEPLIPFMMISWKQLAKVDTFTTCRGRATSPGQQAFGLMIDRQHIGSRNPLQSQLRRLDRNRGEQGWDLFFYQESLIAPVIDVARAVVRYHLRSALGTTEDLAELVTFLQTGVKPEELESVQPSDSGSSLFKGY